MPHTVRSITTAILCLFAPSLFSQIPAGKYLADRRTGCQIWVSGGYNPADSLSVSWDGPCQAQMAEASGTLIWYVKDREISRYVGSMHKGMPWGQGRYTFPGGVIQEGNFADGVLNGQGKVLFGDGKRKLEGNFVDGEILNLDSAYLRHLHKNIIANDDSTDMYVNDQGAKNLLYYALVPPGNCRGAIVLLPGTWDRVEYVLSNNKTLCQLAYDNGLAIITPSVNQRLTLNDEVLRFLNKVFSDAITRYQLPRDKFILGGFSMGGLFSIRYTELACQDSSRTAIVPLAVYSVDGPMDLANTYSVEQRAFERNPAAQEPKYALHEFEKYLGGAPASFPDKYRYYSAYSRSEKDGGNIRFLKNKPLRIYNDVDVNWWLSNRGEDLYDMNALDQSAAINLLHTMGNQRASFINAYGKGYRLDGARHPHSWSIVDATDCIPWILSLL